MDRAVPPEPGAAGDGPPFRTVLGLARYVAVLGLAGLFTGILIGGVGGRLFMRIAGAVGGEAARGATTEAGFTVGEITFGGTLALAVGAGIFVGIVGAAFYVVLRPWLAWAGPWRGVAFGIVLFALGSATSDVLNPDNVDFVILGNEVLVLSMILLLFVGFGVVIDRFAKWLDQRLPQTGRAHPIASGWYVVIAVIGVALGSGLLPQGLFTRSFCDCDPPIVAGVLLVVAAAGTICWIVSAFSSSARLPSIARVLGLVGVAGATTAGLMRAIGDVAAVISG
jgi:hypothetical protein